MTVAASAGRRAFAELTAEAVACVRCERTGGGAAFGACCGPLDALALLVAEAPGARGAAVTGVPLTRDESGRRFEAFLALAGLRRSDVFVTNAVLCHPRLPNGANRAPSSRECRNCRPFLTRTLDIVRAPVVVALGRVALESLRAIAPHDAGLSRDVGNAISWAGRLLVPMYHPGRQSTLHRSHALQRGDWVRLGAIVRDRR